MWGKRNNSRKFQQFVNTRWHRLYRVSYAWTHDPHLSSDLVQETMEKAIRRFDQLQEPEKLDAWLFSILSNCWKDHWRRLKRQSETDELDAEHASAAQDECYQSMIDAGVRDAVANMPDKHRQVVVLIDLEGFSYKEVSEILDIPVGTVMSRLSRAREYLRPSLRKLWETDDHDNPISQRIE